MGRSLRQEDVFQAIAHPARRAVLQLLRGGEQPVANLAKPTGLSAPALSEHLKVLKSVGLVAEHREGRQRIYRLSPEPLHEVYEWMSAFEKYWSTKLDDLGTYLDQTYGGSNAKKSKED